MEDRIEIPVSSDDRFFIYLLSQKVGLRTAYVKREQEVRGSILLSPTTIKELKKVSYFDKGDGVYAMLYFGGDSDDPCRRLAQIMKVTRRGRKSWFDGLARVASQFTDRPNVPLSHREQAVLLLNEAIAQRYIGSREHLLQAITMSERALALDPTLAQALNCKGAAQASLGDNTGAIRSYLAAIRVDHRCMRPWLNLGNRYKGTSQDDRSLFAYRIAVERPPLWDGDDSLQAGALTELKSDNSEGADVALLLLARDGEIDEIFSNHRLDARESGHPAYEEGIKQGRKGKWEKALEAFSQAASDNRNDLMARNSMARALIRLGRADEAIAVCDEVLANGPDFFTCEQTKAEALLMLGRTEKALQCLERISAAHPDNPAVSYYKALLEDHLDLVPQALTRYSRLVVEAPEGCDEQTEYSKRRIQEFLYYRDRNLLDASLATRFLADRFRHLSEMLDCCRPEVLQAIVPAAIDDDDTAPADIEAAAGACASLLTTNPDDPDVVCCTALCLIQSNEPGHIDTAIAGCDHVLQSNPNYVDALVLKAGALLQQARLRGVILDPEHPLCKQAHELLDRAATVDARHPGMLYWKALAEDAMGASDAASRTFRQFVVVAPEDQKSALHYARTRLHHMEFWRRRNMIHAISTE